MQQFAPSRTMRLSDFNTLKTELFHVDWVAEAVGGWNPEQHPCRRWEYAMLWCAYRKWAWNATRGNVDRWKVADFGAGMGLSPAMLLGEADVVIYEPWTMGNQQQIAAQQLDKFKDSIQKLTQTSKLFEKVKLGNYVWNQRGLNELIPLDVDYDIAVCISTLEHIVEYQKAFRDLCKAVRRGGLIFITTDFAEDENDHYVFSNLRAGKMFTAKIYNELCNIGVEEKCFLLDGIYDYSWDDSRKLVNDYGFASMALVKEE